MSIRNESEVLRFKGAAETYCKLLEGQPADIDSWVEHILAALANVYASAQQLPEQDIQDNAPDIYELFEVTPEERKAVYGLVQDLLGWQCGYWSYFDPSEPPSSDDEAVFGDLADDLSDIYGDIKPGLKAWEHADEVMLQTIVWEWRHPLFDSHWGVHAVSAMRALHPIAFLRGVQPLHNHGIDTDE